MELKKIFSKIKLFNRLFQVFLSIFLKAVRILYSHDKINQGRILIISLHKIGDSVFTIPAINSILNEHEKRQVFIMVFEGNKIIYKELFEEQNIFSLNKSNFLFENRIANHLVRKIVKEINPEFLIDLTGTITSASLIFSSSAKKIFGMNDNYFKNVYTDFIRVRKTPHLIEKYSDVAELFLKKKINKSLFEYPINYEKDGLILVHPFAGWAAKEWGLKKSIELVERLRKNFNVSLIFQNDEIEEDVVEYLSVKKINFIQTNDLEELISEIKKCSLFIGNDSGPLYLANYYGKPTFTIYGPTNPEYSKPFGNFHRQIRKILKCTPFDTQYCYLDAGLKCPSNECMNLLDVDIVTNKILEFIIDLEIYKRISMKVK